MSLSAPLHVIVAEQHSIFDKLHPIIVFEGLDGTGKSTQVELLVDKLNAHHLSTSTLMNQPKTPEERHKSYMTNNHLASKEMVEIRKYQAVVVDRYLASTLSSYYANFSFYPFGYSEWTTPYPDEFIIPTLVFNIELDESIRIKRLAERGLDLDFTEQKLIGDQNYRSCMKAWLRVMSTITIDATSMSIEQLHACILSHIRGVI